ncbi:hypothetical protein [Marinibacterium profundimaris]|nr:hypothetical protein [Marinibacterium profundimaris]
MTKTLKTALAAVTCCIPLLTPLTLVPVVAVPMMLAPAQAEAGPIKRACMASERRNASDSLCSCLDQVARSSLKRSDQRKASRFFKDPQKAQETRQSDNPKDEAFWLRYRDFTTLAAATCK